jgi:hypothetical protein
LIEATVNLKEDRAEVKCRAQEGENAA